MIKKLEKAVKDLERRTGSRLAINDYDCDDCGGMQRMTFPGAKYALWCYATSYIDESGNKRIMGWNGFGSLFNTGRSCRNDKFWKI